MSSDADMAYVALDEHDCIIGLASCEPQSENARRDIAKEVARWIRAGFKIETWDRERIRGCPNPIGCKPEWRAESNTRPQPREPGRRHDGLG